MRETVEIVDVREARPEPIMLVTGPWYGCKELCQMCGAVCHGVDDHEPPFHACASCGYVWHVKGFERTPIPQKFDDRDLRQAELFDLGGFPRRIMRRVLPVEEPPKPSKTGRKFLDWEEE